MTRSRFDYAAVLSGLALLLLPAGCPEGGLTAGDGPLGTTPALDVPADAAAARRIGSEGGELRIEDETSGAQGVKLVIPPGAVPAGQQLDFYARVVDRYGANDIVPDRIDTVRAAQQFDQIHDGVVMHPLYAGLVDAWSPAWHVGPVLEFGPENVQFETPVEIHIPFDKSRVDPDEAKLLAVYNGRFDENSGVFSGERTPDITVDYEAGVVIVRTPHLSYWQAVKDLITGGVSRILQSIARPFVDLPEAPNLTDAFAQQIACSGLRPHIDIRRLPDPLMLLYYLASPMDAASRVLDAAQHGRDRDRYENLRVVTGHEVALEDWVFTQPAASVTCEALFGEAYRRTGGDVFQALLLSHNTLRGFDGANRGLDVRGQALQAHMAPLRGDGGDEVGGRYHYFGMATFGFIMRAYSHFSVDFYQGLEIPLIDVDEELVSAIVYAEECLISGDCLSDSMEYALDMRGRDTGFELADRLFDDFERDGGRFDGVIPGDVAERFSIPGDTCLSVQIDGEREYLVTEHVSLQAVVTGGTAPHGVTWLLNGETLMTGPEFFYQFDQAGQYRLRVHVTDDSLLETDASVTVTIREAPQPVDDWLVYYTENVGCWDAPGLHVDTRSAFERWRSTASYSGGGVDDTNEAIKVELEGGFASADAARDWLCARFESRFNHYWCGVHVWMDGQYWWPQAGCDLSHLPVDSTYRE